MNQPTPPPPSEPTHSHARARIAAAATIDARLLGPLGLELAARVAGCLVLLYGQRVTRIVTLRSDDLDLRGRQVFLTLGRDPIEVPDPLATVLRALHAQTTAPWLLPGAKPGNHIGPERIRRRLRQLGIHPQTSRPAALLALAASVPAPVLGELLGYCDDTANHWRRAAAGDWARYASLASTRKDPQMFGANTYTIRLATADDDAALRLLADIDSQASLTTGPVLVGELDGKPEAALSLVDGRVVANPFLPTAQLRAHLRIRAGALVAYERTPLLSARIRAALAGAVLSRPVRAAA
jgi:hypothetical protein